MPLPGRARTYAIRLYAIFVNWRENTEITVSEPHSGSARNYLYSLSPTMSVGRGLCARLSGWAETASLRTICSVVSSPVLTI